MSSSVAANRSAGASDVAATLSVDPGRRICVPFVLTFVHRAQGRLYLVPATLVVQRPRDGFGNERATPTPTDALVELCHKLVCEAYVQSHGHRLTHE